MQHYPMINSSLITSLYKTSEKNKKLNKIGLDQKINSINLTQFMYDTQPDVKRIGMSKVSLFLTIFVYKTYIITRTVYINDIQSDAHAKRALLEL